MDSILESIKKLLLIHQGDEYFDQDLIIHINTAFDSLHQVGVGPDEGFMITGFDETWNDYFPDDRRQQMAKSYIYLKVKTLFDPPNASLMDVMKEQMQEIFWRLMVDASTY